MSQDALSRAIKAAGGQATLASALGITSQAIDFWKKHGTPGTRVLAVEAATNGKISRHELRPDIFGPAPSQSQNASQAEVAA